MTTLPKELEEEIITKFTVEYKYVVDNRDRFSDMEDFLRDALSEVYTTARRQALTDGIEAVERAYLSGRLDNRVFRAEAIAKLTQLRDV